MEPRLAIRDHFRVVGDTRAAFRNWALFLARIVAGRATRRFPETRVVTRQGISVRCPNTPMGRAPIWEVFASEDYPWALLAGGLRPDAPLLVDVGAHVGPFTLALARERPDLRAICFEPSPATFAFLRTNVDENRLGRRVTVRNEAVSTTNGEIPFWEAEPGSCVNSSVPIPDARERRVPSVTLDAVLRGVDGDVDLLKIDCEGAEHEIVRATTAATWARVGSLFLEYHPRAESRWVDLRLILEDHGFRVVWEKRGLQGEPELGLAYLRRAAA